MIDFRKNTERLSVYSGLIEKWFYKAILLLDGYTGDTKRRLIMIVLKTRKLKKYYGSGDTLVRLSLIHI